MTESIFANFSQLEDMFGEGLHNEEVSEKSAKESELISEVVSVIANDQKYDVNPIKMNIEEVSFRKKLRMFQKKNKEISPIGLKKRSEASLIILYVSIMQKILLKRIMSFLALIK